ncbi:MAG TPA: class I SAM-dependent methyltransferase [Terriglobales bacterium]|jgi:2-polyprenyl-3-methyl-5-hydroxy-6-metoxy-1,4-benzoquinol methylase|nr:class I SAM-dependent methyltransferase [Terriglobales bacterium]
MVCCTRYCAAEAKFDRKVAERDLRSYQRNGAAALTRLLLAELRRWPLEGADILDVGGGIGVISMELAAAGVRSVTLVEASPAYLEVARREVGSRYGSRPTQFVLGDFAAIASTLADADVVTLDRVVCCYPDAEALLRGVAARARRLVALTYPRDRWYMRTWTGLQNFWRKLSGDAFRSFIHPPQRMDAVLEAAGFVRAARKGKGVWVLDLFHREGAAVPDDPDPGR